MNNLHYTVEHLIAQLIQNGVLKSEAIIAALRAIDRRNFVRPEMRQTAYADTPLPLGYGSTISQPTVVAFMLELLAPATGEWVEDIGSGSGWTTALLAYLVGPTGRVIGVERVPELVLFGQKNLAKYQLPQAEIHQAGQMIGEPASAPFDKILLSAATTRVPSSLLDQLKSPGTLVLPIGYSLARVVKDITGGITTDQYPGFTFVPLIESVSP